jgi:hypothetical protein
MKKSIAASLKSRYNIPEGIKALRRKLRGMARWRIHDQHPA